MSSVMEGLGRKMRGIMFKFPGMITCSEFENFIVAYLEDELPPNEKRVFEFHLRVCRSCRKYLTEYKQAISAAETLREDFDTLEATVPEDLIAAVLDAKKG